MLETVNNFLTEIIDEDIKNGLSERIHTRFPPEPNGYLHQLVYCKKIQRPVQSAL